MSLPAMGHPAISTGWQGAARRGVLGLVLLLAACSQPFDLIGAVPEEEANEVMNALLRAEVPATKLSGKEGMVSVQVDGRHIARALEVLREHGLPRPRHAGMGQVFKKEGLISSPMEERARYVYALSEELSNTLSRIDGVVHARVHVVLPERGLGGEAGLPSTAAVFIKYRPDHELGHLQPQVRRLVSNAIPGLDSERVSIVLVAAQLPRAQAAVPQAMPRVLGILVVPASANLLAGLLWGLLGLLLLAAGVIVLLVWRHVLPVRRKQLS